MIGYKATDINGCCRGFKFEVGKTYTKDTPKEELQCCTDKVFHFCRELFAIESESNYRLSESRLFEVIAGDYVRSNDKYGTNSLTILREICGDEKKELLNRGNYNSGYCNTGSRNCGDCNTGNNNTGNNNTGYCNAGNNNTGDCNTGSCNCGNHNSGDWNTGDHNRGNNNTGNNNTSYCNAGNNNTGDWNTGNRNCGNYNSGDWNTGSCNCGNHNSGDWNTGNRNCGNHNSGNFNSGNFNSGYFNTDEPFVRMFNKDTKLKKDEVHIPQFCFFDLTVWVSGDSATEEEKNTYKEEINACGGFLKKLDYKEAWRLAWNKANKQEHLKMLELPNWDNEVFKKISGIDAEAEIAKE